MNVEIWVVPFYSRTSELSFHLFFLASFVLDDVSHCSCFSLWLLSRLFCVSFQQLVYLFDRCIFLVYVLCGRIQWVSGFVSSVLPFLEALFLSIFFLLLSLTLFSLCYMYVRSCMLISFQRSVNLCSFLKIFSSHSLDWKNFDNMYSGSPALLILPCDLFSNMLLSQSREFFFSVIIFYQF